MSRNPSSRQRSRNRRGPGVTAARPDTKTAPSPPRPGLCEGLAQAGPPVGQAAGADPEQGTALRVGPSEAGGLGGRTGVGRVDGTAWEDVGPADKIRTQVAADH